MKRDWDLVRDLLEQVEKDTLRDYIRNEKYVQDHYTFELVLGHLEILTHSNIIANGFVTRGHDGKFVNWDFRGAFITLEGHDLLDCLRDKKVWNRIIEKAQALGISISWEFLKQAFPIIIKEILR